MSTCDSPLPSPGVILHGFLAGNFSDYAILSRPLVEGDRLLPPSVSSYRSVPPTGPSAIPRGQPPAAASAPARAPGKRLRSYWREWLAAPARPFSPGAAANPAGGRGAAGALGGAGRPPPQAGVQPRLLPPCPGARQRAQQAAAAHVRVREAPLFPRRGGKPRERPLVAAARSAPPRRAGAAVPLAAAAGPGAQAKGRPAAPLRIALEQLPARAARGPLARWCGAVAGTAQAGEQRGRGPDGAGVVGGALAADAAWAWRVCGSGRALAMKASGSARPWCRVQAGVGWSAGTGPLAR